MPATPATSAPMRSRIWVPPPLAADAPRLRGASQTSSRIHEGPPVHPPHGVPLPVRLLPQPHAERLLPVRHVERAVEPIPDRELEAAVAAEVFRFAAVMQLVVRRADEPLAPARPVREPDFGMPEDAHEVERKDEHVQAQKRIDRDRRGDELVEDPR